MQAEQTLFEIYRETRYDKRYRVVYYTELSEHNRDAEISAALSGESIVNGYFRNWKALEAKAIIDDYVCKLNAGEPEDNEMFWKRFNEAMLVAS